MSFYVRIDEESKSAAQIEQRERTYAAAKVLRLSGYDVEVREYFTGKSQTADAASIVVKLRAVADVLYLNGRASTL